MDATIDPRALWDISYGLYLVTSHTNGKLNGQIANTVFQVSADPPRVALSINKLNLTHDYIQRSGVLAISTLGEKVSMALIGLFGFQSGRVVDKFAQTPFVLGLTGSPIVAEGALSVLEGRVIASADAGTHTVFIAELVRAEVLLPGTPLTYANYQQVKKGHASRNAPTYRGEPASPEEAAQGRFKCQVCGYIYDPATGDPDHHLPPGTAFGSLPDGWTCPICGATKKEFAEV